VPTFSSCIFETHMWAPQPSYPNNVPGEAQQGATGHTPGHTTILNLPGVHRTTSSSSGAAAASVRSRLLLSQFAALLAAGTCSSLAKCME
jgi:hypothetical protein